MEVNFKKKFLVSLIALGIMVSSFLGISLWNKDVKIALADTQSDLSFSLINDNTAYKVTALNKSIVDVSIPAEYNGLPVTEIGDSAINSERDFRKTQQKISNNIENSLQMIA